MSASETNLDDLFSSFPFSFANDCDQVRHIFADFARRWIAKLLVRDTDEFDLRGFSRSDAARDGVDGDDRDSCEELESCEDKDAAEIDFPTCSAAIFDSLTELIEWSS